MSKKQIICCLAFVGVIAILMVVVLVIVRNGTEKQPSEMKMDEMDEMEKPKKSETMTKTESTLKAGTEPNEGNTQKPFEIQICSSANQGQFSSFL